MERVCGDRSEHREDDSSYQPAILSQLKLWHVRFLTHHASNEESMPGCMNSWGSDMASTRRKADKSVRHGKQGILNTASKQQLENEFGTSNEDDVVKKILTEGSVQSSEVRTPSSLPIPIPHDTFTNTHPSELRAHRCHEREPGRTPGPLSPSRTRLLMTFDMIS
jgi:hypothetical protein